MKDKPYGQSRRNSSGVAALFIVISAALLMTVIVVGFVKLMLQDQRQATQSDLSQSAYDSAQAGVEDAKRLLLLNQDCERGITPPSINCATVTNAVTSNRCDTVRLGLGMGAGDETKVQQVSGDERLDQAYTCAKIVLDTPDYVGQFAPDRPVLIPLRGAAAFDTVRISWFLRADTANSTALDLPAGGVNPPLPQNNALDWPVNRPPVVRSQIIDATNLNAVSDLDGSRARTLFFYPAGSAGTPSSSFSLDNRRTPEKSPQAVICDQTRFMQGGYACRIDISYTTPLSDVPADSPVFLNLLALYNSAASRFQVQLLRSGIPVNFRGVQPAIDSTGRANEVFRRVVTRVELRDDMLYPNAALDINGSLCKNFRITDDENDYEENAAQPCDPSA